MATAPYLRLASWLLAGLGSPRLRRTGCAALFCAVAAQAGAATQCAATPWPLWQTFTERFVQPDGRVVDYSVEQLHTTSEGQSYGMFFALVANDRARFESLWRWSVDNLAAGDVASRLPAWQWGKRDDGSWGILDSNAASDADLWFVYALLEAGRAWQRPDYIRDARSLLALIERDEVADLPGMGKMLLPGPVGFVRQDSLWRLNPSYLPIPVLRRLAQENKQGPWQAIAANTARMLAQTTPKGLAADWVAYQAADTQGAFVVDPDKGAVGSYDAIRAYLWAGMTPSADPLAAQVLRTLAGMSATTTAAGIAPESIQADTGAAKGDGPVGYAAALLPYFHARGETRQLQAQRARVQAQLLTAAVQPGRPPFYYDYVLGLFGTGWDERRYRFLPSGKLQSSWENACPRATAR